MTISEKMTEQASEYMTEAEIQARKPAALPEAGYDAMEFARERLKRAGQYSPRQQMGNRFSIGCVALEITQRCNLDCTCCYLSENSEAIKDLPLEEIFRRIDLIYKHYGKGTAVQITGGDPTLRNKDELLQIIRQVRLKGMRPTFFTNGIKAKISSPAFSLADFKSFNVNLFRLSK